MSWFLNPFRVFRRAQTNVYAVLSLDRQSIVVSTCADEVPKPAGNLGLHACNPCRAWLGTEAQSSPSSLCLTCCCNAVRLGGQSCDRGCPYLFVRCLAASLGVTRRCRLPRPQCRPRLNQCRKRPRHALGGWKWEWNPGKSWKCCRARRRWKYCRSCCFLARPSLRCRHLQQEQGQEHMEMLCKPLIEALRQEFGRLALRAMGFVWAFQVHLSVQPPGCID